MHLLWWFSLGNSASVTGGGKQSTHEGYWDYEEILHEVVPETQPSKIRISSFHLTNKLARRELDVTFGGENVWHNHRSKHLGVTLSKSLTYKQQLTKTVQEIKSRNNSLGKLAGTSWGAEGGTLRIPALVLS